MDINSVSVVAELQKLHALYENALMDNDVEMLDALFWNSEHAIRYGPTENLYGTPAIRTFRQARTAVNLARDVERLQITSFGDSTGIINLLFSRRVNDVLCHGRQTQVWVRFPDGWKIVSAHVSYPVTLGTYVDQAAELLALALGEEDRASLHQEFQALSSVAQSLLRFPVDQAIEAAPIFQP